MVSTTFGAICNFLSDIFFVHPKGQEPFPWCTQTGNGQMQINPLISPLA
jgi:hypothetical protein